MKSIEADLLKTAAKEAKGISKAASILSSSYKDQDEKKLRDKLVSKLKQKEMDKMKNCGEKLRDVREGHAGAYEEDELSDISDDEQELEVRSLILNCVNKSKSYFARVKLLL